MRKIPRLFVLDRVAPERLIVNSVTPGCEWVLAGEGVATVKWDGTACLWDRGHLFKRYDAKKGQNQATGLRLKVAGRKERIDEDNVFSSGGYSHRNFDHRCISTRTLGDYTGGRNGPCETWGEPL